MTAKPDEEHTTPLCDHTSVGLLVWRGDNMLLIERRRPPFGFAPPAGHLDGDGTYEAAGRRELHEETGLTAVVLELVLDDLRDNPCRRPGGTWHHWKVYRATVDDDIVVVNHDEAKQAGWYSIMQIRALARRAREASTHDLASPGFGGLEPVWASLLAAARVIDD